MKCTVAFDMFFFYSLWYNSSVYTKEIFYLNTLGFSEKNKAKKTSKQFLLISLGMFGPDEICYNCLLLKIENFGPLKYCA